MSIVGGNYEPPMFPQNGLFKVISNHDVTVVSFELLIVMVIEFCRYT